MQLNRTFPLAALALGPLVGAPVWAGTVSEGADAALEAIQNGDAGAARALLDDAAAGASSSELVVEASELARLEYYWGILEYYDGDREEASLAAWRRALTHDPDFPWDTSLVVDADPQNEFEVLRLDLSSLEQLPSGVPVDTLGAVVYVDGRITRDYDLVRPGNHLVQVMCPDGTLNGLWHEFGAAPDYIGQCPGLVPVEEEKEPRDINMARVALLGVGGALLAGGTAANFLWVNPAWDDVAKLQATEANQVTAKEAESAAGAFNTARWTTIGLLGGGAALIGVGFVVDAPVTILPNGRGAVLVAEF